MTLEYLWPNNCDYVQASLFGGNLRYGRHLGWLLYVWCMYVACMVQVCYVYAAFMLHTIMIVNMFAAQAVSGLQGYSHRYTQH